jgi:membrane dipeptidase
MNDYTEQAKNLHQKALVVDTHCDTTQRLAQPGWNITERHTHGHVDVPRLREGGVDAVFMAVFVMGPLEAGEAPERARPQISNIALAAEQNGDLLVHARCADDIRQAKKSGRIALLTAIEGGYLIDDSLDILREYHQAGAAYMTLTHSFHTTWADSSGVHRLLEPLHGGLTEFGRDVVREMNRLGMMVDVSHVSDDTFAHVLEISKAPIIATHSSCRSVSPHCRNLSDDMIRAVANSGGTVQMNFAAAFIDPNHPPLDPLAVHKWFDDGCPPDRPVTKHVTPLACLVDHFEHALNLVGSQHVGIGSDFDGIPGVPEGMEDCSKLPLLTAALLRRGFSEAELERMLGENVLRVMQACADVAQAGLSRP